MVITPQKMGQTQLYWFIHLLPISRDFAKKKMVLIVEFCWDSDNIFRIFHSTCLLLANLFFVFFVLGQI